ncbi:MAG: hypothetical protein KatS3mg083_291 [Candidatus Dojkabacteria bacterium]|nr:MAG: hypothetical protein KatS3mg083_291 [Candidatus Dojkabacteria bacterium]
MEKQKVLFIGYDYPDVLELIFQDDEVETVDPEDAISVDFTGVEAVILEISNIKLTVLSDLIHYCVKNNIAVFVSNPLEVYLAIPPREDKKGE